MYLNKLKCAIKMIVFLPLFCICSFIALIALLNVLLMALGQIEKDGFGTGMVWYMMAAFGFLAFVLFTKIRKVYRAWKMNRYFEKDKDGLISVEEAARHIKVKQQKCFSLFLDFVGSGLLKKCTVFKEDPTYFLLDNGKKTIKDKFVVMHCNQCGAPSTLRIGFENRCKYCNAIILKKAGEK